LTPNPLRGTVKLPSQKALSIKAVPPFLTIIPIEGALMLKELKARHRNIIQMSFNGFTNNEISEKLEITPSTVSIILHSPLGKAYMNGLHDKMKESTIDVRKKLIALNEDALSAFSRILDVKQKAPFNVQLSAAKDILDRNGYKAPDKLTIDMTLQTKTDEEIDAEIAAMENSINTNKPKEESAPDTPDTPGDFPPIEASTSLDDETILENVLFDPFRNMAD